ncbi:MAG: hypothetical protein ACTHJR_08200 [Sphingomonas sp.]|uniref:hypothetical protein n=1 Tax=Sphingomonas sp. TaxID=28214 RepID=UPI003F8026A4
MIGNPLPIVAALAILSMTGPLAAGAARAQSAPPPVVAPSGAPPNVSYSAPVSTQPLPDELTRAKLIWTTMVAIQQADESGNYSVLRDIASPSFQVANDPSRLTQIFAGIRSTNIDLSNCLLLAPTYLQPPAMDSKGMLRLTGACGLRPTAVVFDLTFQWVANRWKLFGVSLGARSIASGFAPAPAPAPAAPARK